MNPETTIRVAEATDAEAMGRVHVASWQWAYANLLPAEQLARLSVPERARRWAQVLGGDEPGITFVAAEADSLTGFVSVGPGREDVGGPQIGELRALYVHPGVAGAGVGCRLHDAGLQWLVDGGFGLARLWLLRGNDRACRFYQRCGWRPDGAEKVEHRPDGFVLDEIRYERSLVQT